MLVAPAGRLVRTHGLGKFDHAGCPEHLDSGSIGVFICAPSVAAQVANSRQTSLPTPHCPSRRKLLQTAEGGVERRPPGGRDDAERFAEAMRASTLKYRVRAETGRAQQVEALRLRRVAYQMGRGAVCAANVRYYSCAFPRFRAGSRNILRTRATSRVSGEVKRS